MRRKKEMKKRLNKELNKGLRMLRRFWGLTCRKCGSKTFTGFVKNVIL